MEGVQEEDTEVAAPQHEAWVQFQKSISVQGFQTGQITKARVQQKGEIGLKLRDHKRREKLEMRMASKRPALADVSWRIMAKKKGLVCLSFLVSKWYVLLSWGTYLGPWRRVSHQALLGRRNRAALANGLRCHSTQGRETWYQESQEAKPSMVFGSKDSQQIQTPKDCCTFSTNGREVAPNEGNQGHQGGGS